MWAKVNPTVGTHNLTVNTNYWQEYQILGAGALFYAKCSAITQSGTAAGGPVNSRSFNVASAVGRTTLGLFINDGAAATGNGIARWSATSADTAAGWTDRVLVQEIAGAASVTHSISGGGGAWGIGFDLTP